MSEAKLVRDDIRLDRPLGVDAIYIYRLRAWREDHYDEDEDVSETVYTQEYGGYNDQWRPYSGYELLDMEFPGVITIEGRFIASLKSQAEALEDSQLRELQHLLNTLEAWVPRRG